MLVTNFLCGNHSTSTCTTQQAKKQHLRDWIWKNRLPQGRHFGRWYEFGDKINSTRHQREIVSCHEIPGTTKQGWRIHVLIPMEIYNTKLDITLLLFRPLHSSHQQPTRFQGRGIYFIGIRIGLDLKNLTANLQTNRESPASVGSLPTVVVYDLEIRASKCLFWNPEEEQWSNYGCRVCYYFRGDEGLGGRGSLDWLKWHILSVLC